MPVDLLASRLVWCGEPAQPAESEAANPSLPRAGSPETPLPSLDFTPFGMPLDTAGWAALWDQIVAVLRRPFGIA